MAATSFGDPNLVWSKVSQALGTQAGTGSTGAASPAAQNAFRALKLQLSTQAGGPQLQFVPFAEADVNIASSGFTGPTGVFRLYGAWAKKVNTGTTLSFLQVRDNINTTYGALASGSKMTLGFSGPGDESLYIAPDGGGIPYTNTTGSAITCTTVPGNTGAATSSNIADSVHGFLIIGPS